MTCEPIEAALFYARRGWPVFPVAWPVAGPNGLRCACRNGATCNRPAKHPWGPLARHGLTVASKDEAQVRTWWKLAPHANVGLVCGEPAGRWVLDVDPGAGGAASLEQLVGELGEFPPTLEAVTGSGGRHLVFRWPGRKVVTRTSSLGAGLDVRGDGGYIVAAPSAHISGGRYAWLDPRAAVRGAPAWLLERVMEAPELLPAPAPARSSWRPDRRYDRARAYARAYPPAVSGANGHRHTMVLAVHLVVGFELELEPALAILEQEFNGRCQPPWSRRELLHKIDSATRSRGERGYLLRQQETQSA